MITQTSQWNITTLFLAQVPGLLRVTMTMHWGSPTMHMNSPFNCLFRAKLQSSRSIFSHQNVLPKNKPENKNNRPSDYMCISKSPDSGLDCGVTDDFYFQCITDCCRFYECIQMRWKNNLLMKKYRIKHGFKDDWQWLQARNLDCPPFVIRNSLRQK